MSGESGYLNLLPANRHQLRNRKSNVGYRVKFGSARPASKEGSCLTASTEVTTIARDASAPSQNGFLVRLEIEVCFHVQMAGCSCQRLTIHYMMPLSS